MFGLIVTVKVKPEHRERFLQAVRDDALGSIRDEPGCLRFDVLIDNNDPNTVYYYEIYRDEAAFQEHVKAPHYIRYRDATQGMFESQAVRATTFFPPDERWQKQPA